MAEIDDFWDIGALLPKKKKTSAPPATEAAEAPSTVPYTPQEGEKEESTAPSSTYALHTNREKSKLLFAYETNAHPFIRKVSVYEVTSPFHFYHGFREAAEKSLSLLGKASAAPFVPFFSYSPQYAQLSPEQRAYYLYFRDAAHRGEYVRTDKNYLLLFIYEILNTPDIIHPEKGVLLLAGVWAAYRKEFPQMDKYMGDWLADYCLLHRVALPAALLAPFLMNCSQSSYLSELYLGALTVETEEGEHPAMMFLSWHDPYRTRFAEREEVKPLLFHIERAVLRAIPYINGQAVDEKNIITTKTKDAFVGAILAGAKRHRLVIAYQPFYAAIGLREQVTAAVKYAENRLRMHMHVKSRLLIKEMDPALQAIIDAYFDEVLPKEKAPEPVRPAYEAQYDAPAADFSAAEADKIEHASWENTRLLVQEEEEEPWWEEEAVPVLHPQSSDAPPLSLDALRLLEAFFHNKPVPSLGTEAVALAEEINGYFSDTLGDVVLELTEEGILPIFDYQEEVEDLLRSHMQDE
ncbi:MAG: TerB N-terminal domain-containing protein [Clostridia bacterium]|nr:TerB N-terminal domain-containing protein [Clostridia bacterium]